MFNRRQFLARSLKASSLVALAPGGAAVPRPHGPGRRAGQGHRPRRRRDDRRQRRPQHRHPLRRRPLPQGPADAAARRRTRRHADRRPRRPAPRAQRHAADCRTDGQLAVVQGVGYPNPDRSHFESMDIWQSADPKRADADRLARPQRADAAGQEGRRPGPARRRRDDCRWPCQGAAGGVVSLNQRVPYQLDLGRRRAASSRAGS